MEPVRLGACAYAAWSGGQGNVVGPVRLDRSPPCPSWAGTPRTSPSASTAARSCSTTPPAAPCGTSTTTSRSEIDNWNAFTSKKKIEEDDKENEEQSDGDRRPPQAKPDTYGARAGRSTVLHPLDNDSAPEGRLLSIVGVDQPGGGARVEISPDGQTIVLALPDGARSTVAFDYYVDDGRSGVRANATVSVDVRDPGEQQRRLRRARATARRPTRCRTAELWRCRCWPTGVTTRDGDSVVLDSATAVGGEQSGAVARTTSDGRVRFTAPAARTDARRRSRSAYTVTDGRSAPVRRTMTFQVQGQLDQEAFAATAEPDVYGARSASRSRSGRSSTTCPARTRPTPTPSWSSAARPPQAGRARSSRPTPRTASSPSPGRTRRHLLPRVRRGVRQRAPRPGTVRVDVKPRPRARDPIAMPDQLTVYGQSAGIVDVLANDLDPAGGLLAVQRAVPTTPGSSTSRSSTVAGCGSPRARARLTPTRSWSPTRSATARAPACEGEVSVSQRPVPQDNSPVTAADRVDRARRQLGDRAGARQRPVALRRPALPARRRRRRTARRSSRSSRRRT